MSSVLYYSKYCKNCDNIIGKLSKTSIQKDIHFICIDKRIKENNKIYLLLEGGKKYYYLRQLEKFQLFYYYIKDIEYYMVRIL